MAVTASTLTRVNQRQDAASECYRFADNAGVFRYTSAETDVLADLGDGGTYTYLSAAIGRGDLAHGPEDGRRAVEFSLPPDLDLAGRFVGVARQEPMAATIWRRYDSGGDWRLLWSGRVLNGIRAGDTLRLRCEPASVALRRQALRRLYTRNCPHVLYGPDCKAQQLGVLATVDYVNGVEIRLLETGFDDYGGGWLVAPDGTTHMIELAQYNQYLYTLYPSGLAAGTQVQVFKGCDHSLQTCQARFANQANFGGFPWLPKKNPFADNVF
jgi:hypothetical protein